MGLQASPKLPSSLITTLGKRSHPLCLPFGIYYKFDGRKNEIFR